MIEAEQDDYGMGTVITDLTRRLRWRVAEHQVVKWHIAYKGGSPHYAVRQWLNGHPRREAQPIYEADGWRMEAQPMYQARQ